jgi:hypothetical protein
MSIADRTLLLLTAIGTSPTVRARYSERVLAGVRPNCIRPGFDAPISPPWLAEEVECRTHRRQL